MIFSDRPAWSSEDGLKPLPKDSFQLEQHWKWEGEWYRNYSAEFDDEVNFGRTYLCLKIVESLVTRL